MQIRKVVIPAAGLGTRFLPATKALPKEMLPIVDRPLIQYGVEEAAASGIEQVILVTGRGKSLLEDHFDISYELEHTLLSRKKHDLHAVAHGVGRFTRLLTVRQKEPLGLGHAILVARPAVGDEPFAVLLPDDIVDAEEPCLLQMKRVQEQRGGSVIAVMDVEESQVSSYGIVGPSSTEQVFQVRELVEKPSPSEAPSRCAIIGRYILSPRIFDHIEATAADGRGEVQITDALRTLAREEPVWAYRFQGRRFDAGDKLGFLIANIELALKRDDLGPRLRAHLDARRD